MHNFVKVYNPPKVVKTNANMNLLSKKYIIALM